MADWMPPEGHGGRWILACAAGAAVGAGLGTAWALALLPAAGAEASRLGCWSPSCRRARALAGAVLGAAQGFVLRGAYPALSLPAWIGATAVAGYLVVLLTGLIYGALAQFAGSIPIPAFIILGAAVKGVLAGLFYGFAQGRVLDAVVAERASWARVVMVGWMLGTMLSSLRWLMGLTGQGSVSLLTGAIIGGLVEGAALGLVSAAPSASCRLGQRGQFRREVGARRRLVDRAKPRAEEFRHRGEAREHLVPPVAPRRVRHGGVFAAQEAGVAREERRPFRERRQVEV